MLSIIIIPVARSIVLTSSNYDAFEPDGAVSVCAVITAEALERRIIVQLSSQDSTARSKFTQALSPGPSPHFSLKLYCKTTLEGQAL